MAQTNDILRTWNERNNPLLDWKEVRRTIDFIVCREAENGSNVAFNKKYALKDLGNGQRFDDRYREEVGYSYISKK